MSRTDLQTLPERAVELLGGEPDDTTLRRYLHGLPGVDAVGLEQRAAGLGTRSIKTTSKAWALDKIIELIDLTTLEGADTPGKVRSLVAKALNPDAARPDLPARRRGVRLRRHGAARGRGARRRARRPRRRPRLGRRGRDGVPERPRVAARSSSPTPRMRSPPAPTRSTWSSTAARSSPAATGSSSTRSPRVKEACRRADGTYASLKVILETGELNTYDNVKRASWLAILAGGDFIKTSTGKVQPAATLPVTLLMLEVVRDWHRATGEKIGVKPAGGIRTSKDAIKYLVTVAETVGEEWLQPHLFRYGASSLLNDVLLQRQKLRTGHYSGPDYVTID